MKIILLCLLTFSSALAQTFTNVSYQPYTTTITNHDEFIEQYYDLSAATGYRTRRIAASNVLAYINQNISLTNGTSLTNLVNAPVVIAGTNVTVVTNTIAGTGQKTYTVSALVSTNDVSPPTLSGYATNKTSDQSVSVVNTNMVTIPELSVTLPAGVYEIRCELWTTNYVPIGGSDTLQFNLAGGSATISSTKISAWQHQSQVGSALEGIVSIYTSTQVFPAINETVQDTMTLNLEGTIHITGGGTVIPKVRAGQGGSLATEMKVLKDSYIIYTKFP